MTNSDFNSSMSFLHSSRYDSESEMMMRIKKEVEDVYEDMKITHPDLRRPREGAHDPNHLYDRPGGDSRSRSPSQEEDDMKQRVKVRRG